jgi:hypothetical protein
MDSKLFDLITVFNPLDDPFPILYNKEIVRTIPPHSQLQMVRMWGEAGARDLCDLVMRKNKISILNKEKRAEFMAKIILSVEGSLLSTQPSQNELANQLLETHEKNLNPASNPNNWAFDPVTGKPLKGTESMIEPPKSVAPVYSPAVVEVMNGVSSARESNKPPIDMSPEEIVIPPEKKIEDITKETILSWIVNNLPINYNDPETKARIDMMSKEELAKEFRYFELAA